MAARLTTVAVLGLGAMGSRIAARLLETGHDVVVWNRTSAKAAPLVERGAGLATTPAAAARGADAVITIVADASALRTVTEYGDGVVSGTSDGTAVIEMSTVGPDAITRLRRLLPARVGLIDAPVLGSLDEAASGSLAIYAGGPPDLVERWTPLLSDLGTPLYVGALGSGAAAKLVANATLFASVSALGEALALAEGLGLGRDVAFGVLSRTPLASQAARRRRAIEDGRHEVRFALGLARKDANLIDAAAAAAGIDIRMFTAARSWFTEAAQAGWLDRDYTAILTWIMSSPRVTTRLAAMGDSTGASEVRAPRHHASRWEGDPHAQGDR